MIKVSVSLPFIDTLCLYLKFKLDNFRYEQTTKVLLNFWYLISMSFCLSDRTHGRMARNLSSIILIKAVVAD